MTDTHGQRGLGSVLMTMMREEGALRPLRGMGAMVAGAGPAHAFYFAAYERLKVFFTSTGSAHHNYWAQGAAASAATLIHDGIMTPAEGKMTQPSSHPVVDGDDAIKIQIMNSTITLSRVSFLIE